MLAKVLNDKRFALMNETVVVFLLVWYLMIFPGASVYYLNVILACFVIKGKNHISMHTISGNDFINSFCFSWHFISHFLLVLTR